MKKLFIALLLCGLPTYLIGCTANTTPSQTVETPSDTVETEIVPEAPISDKDSTDKPVESTQHEEDNIIIPMVLEGSCEEVAAQIVHKDSYSIAIPTEDYAEMRDGHWQAIGSDTAYFDIFCVDNGDIEAVALEYLGDGGKRTTDTTVFRWDGGNNASYLQALGQSENGYYYGMCHCTMEAMEGFGTRIGYIFDTVTLHDVPTATALTDEEIQEANEAFATFLPDGTLNPTGYFFTSYYARPQDMDLGEFVYYMERESMIAPEDTEEIQDLEDHGFTLPMSTDGTFPVPIGRIPYTSVETLLNQYMNVSLSDMLLYGDAIRSYDYQCFYSYASDFGIGTFACTSGDISGDTVRLYDQHQTLTLQQVEGQWYLVSYLESEK